MQQRQQRCRCCQRWEGCLWIVLAGWWLALSHLLVGCLLCITIIGIPLGVGSFKMAGAVRSDEVSSPDSRAFRLRSQSRCR
jgi:uncharacterized membrane protein YccF (DUF307 family)